MAPVTGSHLNGGTELESTTSRHHRVALIAIVCALAIFAAACGSKKDTGEGTTATTGAASNVTLPDSGQPQSGGNLKFGLEAESDGFNPTVNRWAISGTEVGLAIFDPLVAFDADSKPQPYLAQSITPNADFTVWTITVRPNIKFHDGTPLTGAAITTMFKAHLASALTQPALSPITDVQTTGDLTSQITMKTPWVTFMYSLTSQLGMVPAPSMFDSAGKPTDAGQKAPVGTGPFVFQSWTPDKSFTATKNTSYWRSGLPYLDSIEFRPIPLNSEHAAARPSRLGRPATMMHSNGHQGHPQVPRAGEGRVKVQHRSRTTVRAKRASSSSTTRRSRVRTTSEHAPGASPYATRHADLRRHGERQACIGESANGPFRKSTSQWWAEDQELPRRIDLAARRRSS